MLRLVICSSAFVETGVKGPRYEIFNVRFLIIFALSGTLIHGLNYFRIYIRAENQLLRNFSGECTIVHIGIVTLLMNTRKSDFKSDFCCKFEFLFETLSTCKSKCIKTGQKSRIRVPLQNRNIIVR